MSNFDYNNTLMYEFDGDLEYEVYNRVYAEEISNKQVIWSKGTDYTDLFNKAYQLNENSQYEKAIKALQDALRFNPIGYKARFEMVESYILLNKFDRAKECLLELAPIIDHQPELISRMYRRLGYIYIEEKRYELAFSCLMLSSQYQSSSQTGQELIYVIAEGHLDENIDCDQIIKDNDIPTFSDTRPVAVNREFLRKVNNALNAGKGEEKTEPNKSDEYRETSAEETPVEETEEDLQEVDPIAEDSLSEDGAIEKDTAFTIVDEPSNDTEIETDRPKILFCRKCGAKLLSDSLFCHRCGTKVIQL